MTRYAANLSMLFTDRPFLDRPAAAAAAGFGAVECWWPFPEAVPADRDVDALVSAVTDAGVRLVGLNFAAGDLPAGDRGLLSWPARSQEFRDNIDVTVGIAEQLGCRAFNALYGNRIEGVDPTEQDELAAENLALAGRAAARIGGVALVEPCSGAPRYPLLTAADAVAVLDRVREQGGPELGLLCDVYHLAVNGDDVDAVIERYADRIAHVQVADNPGRGEPGSGQLPLTRWLEKLTGQGYPGWVGLEYKPTGGDTEQSLQWLPPAQRAA